MKNFKHKGGWLVAAGVMGAAFAPIALAEEGADPLPGAGPIVENGGSIVLTTPQIGNVAETTNIPYLAWRGEHVRVAACVEDASVVTSNDLINGVPSTGLATGASLVDVSVQGWTGSAILPILTGPQAGEALGTVPAVPLSTWVHQDATTTHGARWCYSRELSSIDPGMAYVQFIFRNPDGTPRTNVQKLVAWMDSKTPSIREVASTDPTGSPTAAHAGDVTGPNDIPDGLGDPTISSQLGDPSGDGHLNAGEILTQDGIGPFGRIQVRVKGTFPAKNVAGLGSSLTMPDDWAKWANAMATDGLTGTTGFGAAYRWDIHDDDVLRADANRGGVLDVPPVPGADGFPDGDAVANTTDCPIEGSAYSFSRWLQGSPWLPAFPVAQPCDADAGGPMPSDTLDLVAGRSIPFARRRPSFPTARSTPVTRRCPQCASTWTSRATPVELTSGASGSSSTR